MRLKTAHIEDAHQEALITWAHKERLGAGVVGDFLYAIPNGGKRGKAEGARLKKQGVKAGVSDLHLPFPVGGKHGLWIEMKKPIVKGESKPTVSPKQKAWLELMESVGHAVAVCYSWTEAAATIKAYIGGKL